nr:uncharacterized protein LOC127299858 isoform X1 [Lolium perenne]
MLTKRGDDGVEAAGQRHGGDASPAGRLLSRAFSAANPTLLGRKALQGIRSRCSRWAPAFQAGAPGLGALLATRVSSGARPKLPGLLKAFGTGGSAIAVMLYPREVAQAAVGAASAQLVLESRTGEWDTTRLILLDFY